MFRFIHSADWQLGARFTQFGTSGTRLHDGRTRHQQPLPAGEVNTDAIRQERILDVLGAHASRLQILILTCHPERYRGIGQAISIIPHYD